MSFVFQCATNAAMTRSLTLVPHNANQRKVLCKDVSTVASLARLIWDLTEIDGIAAPRLFGSQPGTSQVESEG